MKKISLNSLKNLKHQQKALLIKTFNNEAFESGLSAVQHKRNRRKQLALSTQ